MNSLLLIEFIHNQDTYLSILVAELLSLRTGNLSCLFSFIEIFLVLEVCDFEGKFSRVLIVGGFIVLKMVM